MRPSRICTGVIAILSLAAPLFAQTSNTVAPSPVTVKIESISLQSVQPDRIQLLVKLGLFPERSLKVKAFSFSNMKINKMPAYVSPIDGQFDMKKDQYLKLPDVQITLYYRDLASLEPARQAIEQQKVIVSGAISATLEASLVEQLAMHSFHPRVVLPFAKEIPVSVPGGPSGTAAALAILDVASRMVPGTAKLLGAVYPGQDSAWRNDVGNEQVKHLVLIRTSYTIVDDQASYPLQFEQLGFWIGPSTVMAPRETVTPWQFDPDAQLRLSSNHARIDKASIEITVQPVVTAASAMQDGAALWSFHQKDFKIETEGKPAEDHIAYSDKATLIELRQRASANNYALLRFRDGIAGSPVKLAGPTGNGWDRLAIVRLVRSSAGDDLRTEVVLLPGTEDGKQIRLAQQIDDSGFGSAVFTEDGVIGMVQDESTAILLSSMKHLEDKAER